MSAVVQDSTGNWTFANSASLSACHSQNTGDDNITFGETLTITFDRVVTLTGGLAVLGGIARRRKTRQAAI